MKQNLNTQDNDKINIQGNNAHAIIDSANGGSMLKLSNTVWTHIEINIHKGIYFNESIANLYLEFLIIINSINKKLIKLQSPLLKFLSLMFDIFNELLNNVLMYN